jgi:HlyD family secretion protein
MPRAPWSLVLILLLALGLGSCTREETTTSFQGYAEGEYLYLSAPIAGTLERLSVQRGAEVKAGETLALVEHGLETAAVAEAEAGVRQAESRLIDLGKGGRPDEIAAMQAQLSQARIALDQTEKELGRRQQLFVAKTIAQEALDQAKSQRQQAAAAVDEGQARLAQARLGGREDEIRARGAELSAAREHLTQARWRLTQKTITAPEAGLVNDTFYNQGEFVATGAPVLSLLPPGKIKIRFFVPEAMIAKLAIGQPVTVSLDGAELPLTATITFISPQAEFTPPVIYSRTTRAKLVFMIEAHPRPEEARRLHPGQPLDCSLVGTP